MGDDRAPSDAPRRGRKAVLLHGREVETEFNEFLCGVCGEAEAEDKSDFVLCDGPCLRSFHETCLSAPEKKTKKETDKSDAKWLCQHCTDAAHVCFLCKVQGKDVEEVVCCSDKKCGKHYHRACLERQDDADPTKTQHLVPLIKDVVVDGVPSFKFKCPYHYCNTCAVRVRGTSPLLSTFTCQEPTKMKHGHCRPLVHPHVSLFVFPLLQSDSPTDSHSLQTLPPPPARAKEATETTPT